MGFWWSISHWETRIGNHEIWFFNFCTFSVGGCWGQPMLLFWKLVLIIKMSTSQDFKTTFKYNLTCVFLSLRAQLKKPLCPRTPCIMGTTKRNWHYPILCGALLRSDRNQHAKSYILSYEHAYHILTMQPHFVMLHPRLWVWICK